MIRLDELRALLAVVEEAEETRQFYRQQETSDGLQNLSEEYLGEKLCEALARLYVGSEDA
jgi:hypothetical protein